MKKKIIICVFSILILITAIVFIIGAIQSYNYDITNNPDDKWVAFGSVLTLMVGGFVVIYEFDLFYMAYYFLIKTYFQAYFIRAIKFKTPRKRKTR